MSVIPLNILQINFHFSFHTTLILETNLIYCWDVPNAQNRKTENVLTSQANMWKE